MWNLRILKMTPIPFSPWATPFISVIHPDLSDAISMEKRYFTSDLSSLS